ncbi:MAG: glutathione S-transferase [Burkholderiales bacterium]
MKLWTNPASPFARKVRIVALETKLAAQIEEISIAVSPVKPHAELRRENPLVKIPALATDDAGTLYDSIVICEYLDHKAGAGLFPPPGPARWEALRLHALADGLLEAAVLRRYETAVRPQALQWSDWLDGQRLKIEGGLDAMEAACGKWGDRFAIGQITAACVLGYLDFRFGGEPWRNARPALTRWFERVSARPSLAATAPTA